MLCLGGKPNTKYFTMDFRNNGQIVRLVESEGEKNHENLRHFLDNFFMACGSMVHLHINCFLKFYFYLIGLGVRSSFK